MLRLGHAVAACTLALLLLGVIMVNSANMSLRAHEAVTFQSILLSRPSLYMVVALFAMAVGASIPIRRLLPASLTSETDPGAAARRTPAPPTPPPARFLSGAWFRDLYAHFWAVWPLWIATLATLAVLISVYVPGLKSPRKGAHRWITLHLPGLDSIQPSEVAKWAMVIIIAAFAARWASRIRSFWFGLLPGLAAAGIVSAMVVIEDLGTGALIGASACVVLVAAGARWWQLGLIAPVPIAGAVLAIVTSPYRMARIEAFLNPYLDPQGKGFHSIQSMAAIAGGEITGRGLGNGLQKFDYLPEDTTDFLFSIICEELGVAGALLVIALFGGMFWAITLTARREKVPVLKLIAVGVMSTIGLQAVINLAVVTGLGPAKGIALPLLSSGGTGWVLTAAMLGLVIAIERTQGGPRLAGNRAEAAPSEAAEGGVVELKPDRQAAARFDASVVDASIA